MEKLFSLLRFSLGITQNFEQKLTAEEWTEMFKSAHRQALVGVLFCGVKHLKGDYAPPLPLMLQWTAEAEKISGMNKAFNQKAKALTEFFTAENRKCCILKGQANARLYPEPLSRQPGDIDIFVSGGKDSVLQLLETKKLLKKEELEAYHHVHMSDDSDGITVEVHFRPSSGVHSPFGNKALQQFLNNRVDNLALTPEGFQIPDMPFALAMQMAHIKIHLMSEGVGMRQVTDYYYLLKNSTKEDRGTVSPLLNKFSLKAFASGLMWLLNHIFGLDKELMLIKPNARRGRKILEEISNHGNFGWYHDYYRDGLLKRMLKQRIRMLKMFFVFPKDVFWGRIYYYKFIISTIPLRIRHRTLSLRDVEL